MTGHPWQGAYCDPATNKCYNLRGVEAGGNYTLFILDLATLSVTTHDLGLAVESTDGHYNPGMCGLTSDKTKLICCRARWTALRCLEIDLNAKTARWLGEVAPAGDTSLNYPKWIRVRPDRWLVMARTGDGAQWSFFEFRGEPEQILDSALWSRRAILPNNSGDGVSSCADGGIYFMYQAVLFQDPYEPWKIWMGYHSRCPPPPNRFTYGLLYYDIIRDRFYGWKGDVLDETRTYRSYSPELKVDCPPPSDVTADRPDMGEASADGTRVKTANYDYVILPHDIRNTAGAVVSAGLVKVDLINRTTTPVYLPKVATDIEHGKLWPMLPTADGKVLGIQGYNPGAIVLYDPATDSITEIGEGVRTLGNSKKVWIFGDKALIPATHIVMSKRELIVWSGWSTDMKMLTKCLATGGAGNIRVEADFWATPPSSLEITIYKLPDLTVEATDMITSPSKPFTKTYSVTAGSKRILCRAIP
jgi:hypothetical protein